MNGSYPSTHGKAKHRIGWCYVIIKATFSMCITVTVLNIYDCLFPSVTRDSLTSKSDPTGGSPTAKNDTAKIAWIMLGVSVALSAVMVGTNVYRNRAKRNKRYFIQMLISLKFRILCFVAELFHDKYIHAEIGDIVFM